MGVVTISRQLGSRGDDIADILVQREGFQCLTKELIEERFTRDGISLVSVERYDERSPRFFRHFSRDKNTYLHFLKAAMYECARDGHAVIMGRGGHLILGDLPGVLSVRFVASKDARVERVKRKFNIDQEQAEAMIAHSDAERTGFHRFFFNRDWTDCSRYDLIINSEQFDDDTILDLLHRAMKDLNRKEVQEQSRAALDDLFLQQEVISQIVYRDRLPVQNLEVQCHEGLVELRGMVMIEEHVALVEDSARKVPGVQRVESEVYFIPSYTYVMR